MCDIISIEVNAKINLVLDVAARRADGYHQISSVFHSVALLDRLSIRKAPEKSRLPGNGGEDRPVSEHRCRSSTGIQRSLPTFN